MAKVELTTESDLGPLLKLLEGAALGAQKLDGAYQKMGESQREVVQRITEQANLEKQTAARIASREKEAQTTAKMAAEVKKLNDQLKSGAAKTLASDFKAIEAEAKKLIATIAVGNLTIEEQAAAVQQFADTLDPESQAAFFAGAMEGIDGVTQELLEAVKAGAQFKESLTTGAEASGKAIQTPKQRLRELKTELSRLDESDPAFVNLAIEAAQLEDKIGDVNARIRNLAADGKNVNALISAAEGATGAFAIFQGVLGVTGDESEALQQTLLKVQSAMAILNGLQAVQNALLEESAAKSVFYANAQKLVALATGTATGAAKAFRLALLATGIGALVVAIGVLAANWDKVKLALSGSSVEQREYLENAKQVAQVEQDKFDAIDGSTERLKQQGLTEEEILQIKLDQLRAIILAEDARISAVSSAAADQVRIETSYKNTLTKVVQFLSAPLSFLASIIDSTLFTLQKIGVISQDTAESIGSVQDRLNNAITSLVFDPEETKANAEAELQEIIAANDARREQIAGFENQITANRRQAAAQRKKDEEEAALERIRLVQDTIDRIAQLEEDAEAARIAALDPEARVEAQRAAEEARLDALRESLRAQAVEAGIGGEELAATYQRIDDSIAILRADNQRNTDTQLAEIRRDGFLATLDQAEQLARSEAEISINAQRGAFATQEAFEAFKSERLLQIDLDLARKRLEALLSSGVAIDDVQRAQLEQTISNIELQIGELRRTRDASAVSSGDQFLMKLFGLDEQSVGEFVSVAEQVSQQAVQFFGQITAAQLDDNARLIASLDDRIRAKEEALNAELELEKQGYANSAGAARESLEKEKKARAEAAKERQRLQRQQLVADAVAQSSALITAGAQIFAAEAWKGALGVAKSIASILTILGFMVSLRAKAKSISNVQARKGLTATDTKIVKGRSHEQGGERLLDHIEVEGDEMVGVLSRPATRKFGNRFTEMVSMMNAGIDPMNSYGMRALNGSSGRALMEAGRASGAARMFGGGALLEEVKALKLENRAMREELTYIRKEVRDWPKSYREGSAEVVKVGNKTIVNRKES